MNLPRFATQQPVLINMTVLLVLIAGMLTFATMTKEEWPDIGSTHATVTVLYPGASPVEVEKLVTVPIEEQIEAVQEIDTVTSTSSEGMARLFIEFDAGIRDYDLRLQELQREVGATPDLPEDAEDPIVTSFRFGNSRVIHVGIRGSAPEHQLQAAVRDLEDALKRVPGVERVDVDGKRDREIWVEVDPHLLSSYGLALQDIIGALQRANQNVAGGTVESGAREFLVRTVGEAARLDELSQLIVKRGPEGRHVYLSDVAVLGDTFADETSLTRINGTRSVNFTVHKVVGGDTLRIVEVIDRVLTAERAQLPPGLEIITFNNTAEDISARLTGLYQNGALGLILVLGCLYAFVGLRPALMTALGIPFAVFLAFITMQLLGITINTITLFSIIITIG